ncbi:hypothetical protein OG352_05575 [Streptomyces sp. NBC_01485]|uniref:hypothetical protein n=1 Tax=Streptomyces sp. NBC_01485 TaxID=2903884 RepID=UPI002E30394A|nr:hypothetical protein [Streptomyces sp. NBC_01485]
MITPNLVRRLRAYTSNVQIRRLRVQLSEAQDRNRCLEQRLADLQTANEAAYKELREATGGPLFDQKQPFGAIPVKGSAT